MKNLVGKKRKAYIFSRFEGGERAECYPGVAGLVTINLSAPAKIYHPLPSPIGHVTSELTHLLLNTPQLSASWSHTGEGNILVWK